LRYCRSSSPATASIPSDEVDFAVAASEPTAASSLSVSAVLADSSTAAVLGLDASTALLATTASGSRMTRKKKAATAARVRTIPAKM
jgi:hypothetical protein